MQFDVQYELIVNDGTPGGKTKLVMDSFTPNDNVPASY